MKVNVRNLFDRIMPLLLMIAFLMPVSSQNETLNMSLSRLQLYFSIACVILAYAFNMKRFIKRNEYWRGNRKTLYAILVIALLLFFSVLTALSNEITQFSTNEFLKYMTICVILGPVYNHTGTARTWRNVFVISSAVIVVCGILMILGNEAVWNFFCARYVNHYKEIYRYARFYRKPVTFFAANAIASPIYYCYFMMWELCEQKRKIWISWLFKAAFILLIVFCRNNSSLLCLGLIAMYYVLKYRKQLTGKHIFILSCVGIATVILVIENYSYIASIFTSESNGILGRFSSTGKGILREDIDYIIKMKMPIGLMTSDLLLTDCGILVYAIRGSVFLPFIIFSMLYYSLKESIKDSFSMKMLFLSLVLFEVGYPLLISQRFIPFLLFMMMYYKRHYSELMKNES